MQNKKKNLYTPVMCMLVFLAVVLANLAAGELPARIAQFDISAGGLYSVSRQTEEIAQALTDEVTLALISSNGFDEKLERLLQVYDGLSGKIRTKKVDPDADPTYLASYTSDRISDNSVLVIGPERTRLIRSSDFYPTEYDYATGYQSENFDGEGQLTAAIRYVSEDVLQRMYLLSGHGETTPEELVQDGLKNDGWETVSLSLTAAEAVPEDCDCLLINAPVSDLTRKEKEVLQQYLMDGGHLMLVTGGFASVHANLQEVLAGYGLGALDGIIVERDENRAIPSYYNFLLPTVHNTEITGPLFEENAMVLVPNAHAIVLSEEKRGTVETEKLLSTTEKSYLKAASASTYDFEEGDTEGPFVVAARASEQAGEKETRIVWFSSTQMLTADVDEMVNGSNLDLALNAFNYLNGADGGITIRPKALSAQTLRLSAAQARLWSVVYIGVLPVLLIVTGVIIIWRRKKRQ